MGFIRYPESLAKHFPPGTSTKGVTWSTPGQVARFADSRITGLALDGFEEVIPLGAAAQATSIKAKDLEGKLEIHEWDGKKFVRVKDLHRFQADKKKEAAE